MRSIKISDTTMTRAAGSAEYSLSFKDKIDIASWIDKLQLDVIELEGIEHAKLDPLRIKSIISAVQNAVVAVPVKLDADSVLAAADAVKQGGKVRLQVPVPVSSVQMEYLLHMKADKAAEKTAEIIKLCRTYTDDVEFVALDAVRSEKEFLYSIIDIAMSSGATTVTVCDEAGSMLPHEFSDFIKDLYMNVPSLRDVVLGVCCSDQLSMAAACAMAAMECGAGEIKTAAHGRSVTDLKDIIRILNAKGDVYGVECGVRTVELGRVLSKIDSICETVKSKNSPFDDGVKDSVSLEAENIKLSSEDDKETVLRAVKSLGYELSDEDVESVWESFKTISSKKEIGSKELDAIVASAAMQVPAVYELDTYMINIGNQITCMAHIRLKKNGELCEGMALGDGPVDASFLALEQITGHHYVLDDFQIRAVTEGHEAMGETIVKLQSDGKIYPGRGLSTDIVGSSVLAYINALNKITYEETEE